MRAGVVALALLCGCYDPALRDGQFSCAGNGACPSGFECVCASCVRHGAATSSCNVEMGIPDLAGGDFAGVDLAAAALDLAGADLAGAADLNVPDLNSADLRLATGCSLGTRSAKDPGHANVALCNAAWAVQGITSSATPCNRIVGTDGKNGGTNCTAYENCAVGWHLCGDELELMNKGLTAGDCSALNNGSGGLWISNTPGGPPASPGPPQCMGSVSKTVFGCGSFGNAPDNATCHVLQRALVNPPDAIDDCSVASSGAFLCGTATAPEATTVTKPMRDTGGGVICCHD